MMTMPSSNQTSSRDAQVISSADAPSSGGGNPIWLLVGAGALFFAFAAALLASG